MRAWIDALDRDICGLRARIDREPLPKAADTPRVTINPTYAPRDGLGGAHRVPPRRQTYTP